MAQKNLTLAEIEAVRQKLDEEIQEHELVFLMGLMGKPEMIERTVRVEVAKRWLTLTALLMRNKKSDFMH
jgi:hypothetical protein